MELLPSQHLALERLARQHTMGIDVEPDYREGAIWRYKREPTTYWFEVAVYDERFLIRMAPGVDRHEEVREAYDWEYQRANHRASVTEAFWQWLDNLKRESRSVDLAGDSSPSPDWLLAELPPRMMEIREEIRALKKEASALGTIGALLWQTGEPLNEAVCEMFRALRFDAEPTEPGATYDVRVRLDDARRLLIEVTGTESCISKKSVKISQILQAVRDEQKDGDRVVLAVNAYRDRAPDKRSAEIATSEALKLITGLKANLVSTVTLYRIWQVFLHNPDVARDEIFRLHALDGDVFS